MTTLSCRFCQSALTHTFCDLGMSPISNAFVDVADANTVERFYPLHALVCENCRLVQLGEYESADEIFDDNYAYFSSFSDSWLKHSEAYVELMMERFGLDESSLVVEVASNDGYLLQYFLARNVPVLGIEPTENTAKVAQEKGIESLVKFFGRQTAEELVAQGRRPNLLLGNNVLAHVPDINDFVGGMKIALAPEGVVTMEFPHLLNLIECRQFDTIYHEHFSYLSLLTVQKIFAHHGLTVFDVQELPTHGGSLRIYARHAEDDAKPVSENVTKLLDKELAAGLDKTDTYTSFQNVASQVRKDLVNFLMEQQAAGKSVVGYGAPAKGNTLLNYCGVRSDWLSYTVDRSPRKQNSLLPGVRIPVYAPEKICQTKPDYVLILPWNLQDEITEQLAEIRSWGGQFVVAIPELKVI